MKLRSLAQTYSSSINPDGPDQPDQPDQPDEK